MNQEMPIIKLGGPQKFSHQKWWASVPPTFENHFSRANNIKEEPKLAVKHI